MLFPRTHAWTRAQRRSMIAIALLSVLVGGALIYAYERYYRGPSESAFYGSWEATLNEDLTVYYEFRSDHSFVVFGSPDLDEESFLVRGRWYAGGPNMYLRYLDEGWMAGDQRYRILSIYSPTLFASAISRTARFMC